jgi:hypothetical protein
MVVPRTDALQGLYSLRSVHLPCRLGPSVGLFAELQVLSGRGPSNGFKIDELEISCASAERRRIAPISVERNCFLCKSPRGQHLRGFPSTFSSVGHCDIHYIGRFQLLLHKCTKLHNTNFGFNSTILSF